MVIKKPTLTPSKLDMLSRCGEQYRRRYIEGEILPPGVALLLGSGVHKAVEENLRNWMDKQAYLPLEQVQEIAGEEVKARWSQEPVHLTEDEVALGMAVVKGQTIDEAARMATLHHKEVAPNLKPTDLERLWRIELQGFPFDLSGRIDVEEATEGTDKIRDTKVSGKTPPANVADTSLQLTFYGIEYQNTYGRPCKALCLDYLVRNKTAKYVCMPTIRDQGHFNAALRRVEAAAEIIEKEAFIPAQPDSWMCTPKFCGYYLTCPYAHGHKQYSGS